MTKHAVESHPDTAKEMEKMNEEDPKKWGRKIGFLLSSSMIA
jgi:hypothetical protein